MGNFKEFSEEKADMVDDILKVLLKKHIPLTQALEILEAAKNEIQNLPRNHP